MARFARVVVPGVPHHVVQRGNRRQDVFFDDDDRRAYLDFLAQFGKRYGVEFWGYCLMSNHVHLLAVPRTERSLALGIGWAHHYYTRRINFREDWRGYLWQGRFHSCPLDDKRAAQALRYVELNPVRAGLVQRAEQWPWSSARAHAQGEAYALLTAAPIVAREEWCAFLTQGEAEEEVARLRACTRRGRPCGDRAFVENDGRSGWAVLYGRASPDRGDLGGAGDERAHDNRCVCPRNYPGRSASQPTTLRCVQ